MKRSFINRFLKTVVLCCLVGYAVFVGGDTSSLYAQGVWKGFIIPQEVANSRGLQRQWIASTDFNPYCKVAEHLNGIVFDRDAVFTVTDQGTAQGFEAETGKTKWITYVKTKGRLVQGLAASQYYVAFTAGSTLYVLNRENGRILLDADVPAIPTNNLTLGETRAYVPAINGLIYIYDLQPMEDPFREFGVSESMLSDKERQARKMEFINSLRLVKSYKEPMSIRSIGDLKVSPITTRCNDAFEYVAWPTGSKLVTVCEVDKRDMGFAEERYNIPVMGEVTSPLSYKPYDIAQPLNTGIIYAGTEEGFVYALREMTGTMLWRFPTGECIKETPVYVDGEVFVITALSGMYCIDAEKGGDGKTAEAKWWSPDIKKFIACSKHRVYALDKGRMLVILDRVSGQRIASLPMMDYRFVFTNIQNDRIYFATETGVIQCVREVALGTPLDYSAEWIKARTNTIDEERRAERKEAKSTKKKHADRMGDDEDGGWGEGDDDDDDSGFGLGDDDDDDDSGDDDSDLGFGDDDDDSGDDDDSEFGDDDDTGDDFAGDDDDDFSGDDDDDMGEEDFAGDEEAGEEEEF